MTEGDVGDAMLEKIQQLRLLGHGRQTRIVTHHQHGSRRELAENLALGVNLVGALARDGRRQDQTTVSLLWRRAGHRHNYRVNRQETEAAEGAAVTLPPSPITG